MEFEGANLMYYTVTIDGLRIRFFIKLILFNLKMVEQLIRLSSIRIIIYCKNGLFNKN
jgi:hypothetical protein